MGQPNKLVDGMTWGSISQSKNRLYDLTIGCMELGDQVLDLRIINTWLYNLVNDYTTWWSSAQRDDQMHNLTI